MRYVAALLKCGALFFALCQLVYAQSANYADSMNTQPAVQGPTNQGVIDREGGNLGIQVGSPSMFNSDLLPFFPAFMASISMIIVSELGDKTFFIAAIMAMRHNRLTVLAGAMMALGVMTVLSAGMGYALPNVLPRNYTQMAATALFLYFGLKLLKDAYGMAEGGANEELEEVESELDKKEIEESNNELESGVSERKTKKKEEPFFSPVFVQCFTMTFLAEWGDRSQIATIALAAAKNPVGVTLGGIIGHALCTGLAVVGGKLLASRISEKAVATMGGILFLLFAVHSIIYKD